jgi:hypothetical protein
LNRLTICTIEVRKIIREEAAGFGYPDAVPFMVVQCHACIDVFLQDARKLSQGAGSCPACGAPATVMASTFYTWGDRLHFDELRAAVRSAHLSAPEATELLRSVRAVTDDEAALRRAVRAATGRIRSVTLVRGVQAPHLVDLHHTVGMLLIVLGALVTACGRES